MKVTLGKIADTISILDKIKQQTTNFKIGYWVMRNMKILSDSFNFFIENREKIYEKYCEKIKTEQDPKGTYFEIDIDGNVKFNIKKDTDVKEFNNEMMELINMECTDIEPYLLDVETIENNTSDIKIRTDEIFTIDYLLSE